MLSCWKVRAKQPKEVEDSYTSFNSLVVADDNKLRKLSVILQDNTIC